MAIERRRNGLAYAPRGLIGVLTPQANTTVEPEFNILLPPGQAVVGARLSSRGTSIETRLADYAETLPAAAGQFANAPVDAYALATTGVSYVIGAGREDALVDGWRAAPGAPLVTAALAVCDALAALSARRIALLSPYPPALTEASIRYWRSRALEVRAVESVYRETDGFHPIYTLGVEDARDALDRLRGAAVHAVVMLGTGLPTLAAIAERADDTGPPVLSCMLCLAWRSSLAAGGGAPDGAELAGWIQGQHWRHRLHDA